MRATENNSAIAKLAGVVWRACYPGIIRHAQIEYMLARIYALDILRERLSQSVRYDHLWWTVNFPVLRLTGQPPNRA